MMIIIGAILAVLGLASTIYGSDLNNSWEAQWNAMWNTGKANPGNVWIIVGVAAIILGIALIILGYIKKQGTKENHSSAPLKTLILCPHCRKELNGSPAFCPYCGRSTKIEASRKPEPPKEPIGSVNPTRTGWSTPSDDDL